MEQFPHLKLVQKVIGRARLFGGGSPNANSEANKENRQSHSASLIQQTTKIKYDWNNSFSRRDDEQLAPLNKDTVTVFLQINPDLLNGEFDLQAFGIEIISEENEGFIIGASVDNLRSLEDKINGFVNTTRGTARVADLWRIIDGNREDWKPRHILSDTLFETWSKIDDNAKYKVEVSLAFDRPLGAEPDHSKQGGASRLQKYTEEQIRRDERLMEREQHFETFISYYGEITSNIVELEDCFGCEVSISGKGLKDLVVNYPFVFEVNELEETGGADGGNVPTEDEELDIIAPQQDSPVIGVIDSGLMEGHKYLHLAIDHANSKSYLRDDKSTADNVQGGGHGTRVAGAILYPLGISKYQSPYQLPCIIRNLRILDSSNQFLHSYPAELMMAVISDNPDCSIFNLSVTSTRQHRRRHMSSWAACIDQEMFNNNKLFIISSGNVIKDTIKEFIRNGINYPTFLEKPYCSVANPAQSCFAITVGSVNHVTFEDNNWKSLGDEKNVSAFSRIGPGIWNTIKPDVVEFGGGLVASKGAGVLVRVIEQTAPELLRSTLHGGAFNGLDAVGTSFAAPKVAHIVAYLKKLYPNETINLLRALLIQGARHPDNYFLNPTTESVKHFGYGIPSLERVTKNTEHRISFYSTSEIKAEEGHIYSLKIPEELRNQGDEYDILIEVTLAYTAKVRRTRQKIKSYLATWLSWSNSKLEESFESFKEFALKEIEGDQTEYDKEARKGFANIDWKIGNRIDAGEVQNFSRSGNTIQKDWATIKSFQLPEEIGFVVSGHRGWDKNKDAIPYAFVVSIEILGNNIPIYESIRVENEIEIEI